MTKPAEPCVYVVDDDEVFRDSLKWLLESSGWKVETFSSSQHFLDFYRGDYPGCLVLDIRMPGISGLVLQEKLQELHFTIPIIFITGHGDVPMAVQAVQRGAMDFIEKPYNDEKIVNLVQAALKQDKQMRASKNKNASISSRIASMTPREREVMDGVIAGKLNKIIADELGISIKTVEAHRAKVMEKMQVNSAVELVQLTLSNSGS